MLGIALKGLLGRKLRAALTAVAILLGVATVSGTYVLTDSIDKAFDSIFTDIREGSNVVITGKAAFDLSDGSGVTAPAFDQSLLKDVRALPGVAEADGSVNGEVQLIGRDGKAVVYGGAPNLGFSIARPNSPFNRLTLVTGSWPSANEVVVDKSTAGKEHFDVGEVVGVQGNGSVQRLRISGIVKFGTVATIGGATLAGFDLPTAQRLLGKPGQLDEIAVAAKTGVSDPELLRQIREILPADTQVRTGTAQAKDDAADTNEFVSFLQTFLLAFGGVALFVGSFVIANSLSITIAQRTRARDAANGRRLQAADPAFDRRRGARRGNPRLGYRAVRRPRTRERAVLAVRRGRVHAAEQRADLRHAHDRLLAGGRHPRHVAGQPSPCDSSNAGATNRSRP